MVEKPVVKLVPLYSKSGSGKRVTASLLKSIYPELGKYHEFIAGPETNYTVLRDALKGRKWFAIENASKEIVGAIALTPRKKEGWVGRLFISEEYRKQEYANAAINALKQHATRKGIRELHAYIAHVNEPSRKAFTKAGFRENPSMKDTHGKVFTHKNRK